MQYLPACATGAAIATKANADSAAADAVIIFAIDFTLCSPFRPVGLAERCRPACAWGRVGISTRTKKWNRLFGINKEWPAFSSPNCPPSRRRAGRGCRRYQRFRASDRRSDFDGRRIGHRDRGRYFPSKPTSGAWCKKRTARWAASTASSSMSAFSAKSVLMASAREQWSNIYDVMCAARCCAAARR
jgi:hypothetical protein